VFWLDGTAAGGFFTPMEAAETTSADKISTWADKRKVYFGLLKHPQLKLASRVCGLEDLFPQLEAASRQVDPAEFPADPALNARVAVWYGDITQLAADAVVNAAHALLTGGGGVDGAFHSRAGPGLLAELAPLAPCPPGECRVTGGHGLPVRWIIHTVGPYGEDPELLARCYTSSLAAAAERGATSVGFCCISAGHYKYPTAAAALVALTTVRRWLSEHATPQRVIFVVHTVRDEVAYEELLPFVFPQPPL